MHKRKVSTSAVDVDHLKIPAISKINPLLEDLVNDPTGLFSILPRDVHVMISQLFPTPYIKFQDGLFHGIVCEAGKHMIILHIVANNYMPYHTCSIVSISTNSEAVVMRMCNNITGKVTHECYSLRSWSLLWKLPDANYECTQIFLVDDATCLVISYTNDRMQWHRLGRLTSQTNHTYLAEKLNTRVNPAFATSKMETLASFTSDVCDIGWARFDKFCRMMVNAPTPNSCLSPAICISCDALCKYVAVVYAREVNHMSMKMYDIVVYDYNSGLVLHSIRAIYSDFPVKCAIDANGAVVYYHFDKDHTVNLTWVGAAIGVPHTKISNRSAYPLDKISITSRGNVVLVSQM